MNETLEGLYRRKSVRSFEEKPVPEELKRAVLEAAVQAPTAGNQQLYTILDITDQAVKDRLAETCDHQLFIAKAPVVLIFCADCLRWWEVYQAAGYSARMPEAGDLMLAVTDACIAAQNAVVAAESLGLGSCYIGDVLERYEDHRLLLNLPTWVMPACMLVMGWPTQQQKNRPKPERFPLDYVVRTNRYLSPTIDEHRGALNTRAGGQVADWVKTFCARKYESGFSREMNRSVWEYLRDFEKEEPD